MPVTTELRVRYAETDQMGIVYYANFFVWFEIGRVELLRSFGSSYRQLETDYQCMIPVIDASCRYRAPARYDDEIQIETRPSLVRESVIKFAYRVYRKANQEGKERELLAEGETGHVICDRQMNRKPLPDLFREPLRAMMAGE
jgi:acyl-CoA thioester hydrolase